VKVLVVRARVVVRMRALEELGGSGGRGVGWETGTRWCVVKAVLEMRWTVGGGWGAMVVVVVVELLLLV
jgi:hypothetical protein